MKVTKGCLFQKERTYPKEYGKKSLGYSRTRKETGRAGLAEQEENRLVQGKDGQVVRGRSDEALQAMAESWEYASLHLLSVNLFLPFSLYQGVLIMED